MNWNASTIENLRRVFTDGFVARDIAESLVSFDASTSASEVAELMDRRNFDVVGVRKEGVVVGYVERADLCGELAASMFDPSTPQSPMPPRWQTWCWDWPIRHGSSFESWGPWAASSP